MCKQCRRCGKEATDGQIYCRQCRDAAGSVRPGTIWLAAGLFSLLLLALSVILFWHGMAATWDLSWDRIAGRPVATINGEAIERWDYRQRIAASSYILERQYGADIFEGKEGQANLLMLHKELLDRMVEERLIAQEAKRLDIHISNEQVEKELQRISREVYGSQDNLHKNLQLNGMTSEGMKSRIRILLTTQALMNVKSATGNSSSSPELLFASWLTQSKSEAKVVLYDSSLALVGTSERGGGCCAPGGIFSAGVDDAKKDVQKD